MNVFIVYAHPSNKSFTYQILDALLKGLELGGHATKISDLYAMDFRTDMTAEEYEREAYLKTDGFLPEDIVAEQLKIEWADSIIFLYPLWWSDCPAKLKGWFDRVYSVGYAYGYDENGNQARKMKTIKYGIAMVTAGHTKETLESMGIAGSIHKIILEDRMGDRFENKELVIYGGTLNIEKVKGSHLNNATQLGEYMGRSVLTK
ncbi:NAD(P)H-dependent oxidoreductase [Sphingobacterium suaedae]|uniref:NAD(P)H-dependent oxidoreductase n=1 Tax=Sphingobacterium suaedae TaxID=1686402 RepID=A0ABW5KG67_9SPHI